MNRDVYKALMAEKRSIDTEFAKAEKAVKGLLNILIVLKIIDLLLCLNILNFNIAYFFNAGVFILFSSIVKAGYRAPVYLWIIGCAISIPTLITSMDYFGVALSFDMIIILETGIVVFTAFAVLYLLLHPVPRYFFEQAKYLRIS